MSNWIQVYSGKKFWPLDPGSEDVDIHDIAHQLSLKCRFTGCVRTFYSVAEHCVRVSRIVPPEHAFWALMHDSGEFVLPDLPRPIKTEYPILREVEVNLLKVIAQKFDLCWPEPSEVKKADDILLATEVRDLMLPPVEADTWRPLPDPLPDKIYPHSDMVAEEMFLDRFNQLYIMKGNK